ncbi:MAG: DUF1266 domain-containing protein [Gordonia sp. (in: high G+C Gram-positive bacteria)]|uniref:DUF1266 domain-containing protein n=1 Tax=Gordonia sp. (in: high G+C Gram-positive bacteria) TaxID=84139 RepID=UPI0039E23B88
MTELPERYSQLREADDVAWTVPPSLAAAASGELRAEPRGALYGETAQAFALDAPMSVAYGMRWNSLDLPGYTVYDARLALSADMEVNDPDEWVAYLGRVLDPASSGDTEAILQVRADLIRACGGELPAGWVAEMHDWLTRTDQDGAHDRLDELAPAITEVDRWLTESGLLSPGSHVATVTGYQAGHAIYMTRLGAKAGYADHAAVTQALLAARDLVATGCASWHEHAVSLVAGAALMARTDHARTRFDAAVSGAATCLIDPDSPWRVLRFPIADITIDDLEEQSWDF